MTATEESGPAPFGEWCIVEMFGHRRLAGYVTADAPIMTASRLRVDIYPGSAEQPSMTQFVTYPAAVYCLTPTSELIARAAAQQQTPDPVARWELQLELERGDPADMYGNS